ncbi:hypothetical protein F4825DRAFT_24582 [Nemania diffusa]|nr:hypothetical protein F4825DRAFT_24582 [Nemania diffusa]
MALLPMLESHLYGHLKRLRLLEKGVFQNEKELTTTKTTAMTKTTVRMMDKAKHHKSRNHRLGRGDSLVHTSRKILSVFKHSNPAVGRAGKPYIGLSESLNADLNCSYILTTLVNHREHLNRKHALPISCRRCYTAFDTEEEHDTHVRSSEQCEVRQQPSPVEGFNARQKDELKSRPRGLKHMSEPQKWRHVYLILFPETVESNIPSPYYEFQTLSDPGHPRDLMTEYEEYLQRELPPGVLEQLKIRIEQEFEPVEEELREQIVDIARDMQLELFRSFMSSIRHGGGGSRYGAERTEITSRVRGQEPNKSTPCPPVNNVALQSPEIRPSLEDELAAWCPEPYLDLGFDGFDGQLYDFGQV